MNYRDKLVSYRKSLINIKRNERLLKALEDTIDCVSVTDPTNTVVQGGEQIDRVPIKLQRIESIKRTIALDQNLVDGQWEELNAVVGALPGDMEGFVLKSYFMWLLDHVDIAEQLYGDNVDWNHRISRERYLARVRQLKSDGLKNLETVTTIPMRLGV